MVKSKAKWNCNHCSQTSSRYWNLKKHIERMYGGIGRSELSRHPQTFLHRHIPKKEENSSKKRDPLDIFLEFWRPIIKELKKY
jgi:hypothetical protein